MNVDTEFLLKFKTHLLEFNPLNRQYRQIGEAIEGIEDDSTACFQVQTHDFEIASITSLDYQGTKVIRVAEINRNRTSSIPEDSPKFEPLCYPLLFLYGEHGWSKSISKTVSHSNYMTSRLLMPEIIQATHEENAEYLIGYCADNDPSKFIPTNRFQALYRVGQTWTVDNTARIVDTRLKWHKDNKLHIFGRDSAELNNPNEEGPESDSEMENESETEVGEDQDSNTDTDNDNDLSEASDTNEDDTNQADPVLFHHHASEDENANYHEINDDSAFFDELASPYDANNDTDYADDERNSDFDGDDDPAARFFDSYAEEEPTSFSCDVDFSEDDGYDVSEGGRDEDYEDYSNGDRSEDTDNNNGASFVSDNFPQNDGDPQNSSNPSTGATGKKKNKHNRTYLCETMHGSKRFLKKRAINALSLVSELGKAHGFLTLTCNTNWPELVEALGNLTAYDNPTITNRVFHQKLEALLKNLRNGHYFDGKKTVYDIRVIEYQHRGLPHAHVVFRLKDVDFANIEEEIAFIDKYFQAEMPSQEEDPEYYALVLRYMIHHHSSGVNGCRNKNGQGCKKGFNKTEIGPSGIDEKGYPIYRRSKEEDKMVVVHNREILIDWNGHACLEFASSTNTLMYLYKV